MLVYYVSWVLDKELSKGKGRSTSKEFMYSFSVLCRSSHDAIKCLEWLFEFDYKSPHGFSLCDGVVTLTRLKIDSRNFSFRWLYMDDIKRPILMSDLKDSLTKYAMTFMR